MKTVWNWIQAALAVMGGGLGWFFGEMDGFFYALIAFVVIDYLTGVMCAILGAVMELRQHIFELLRDGQADMARIFQKAHTLVGNVEEDHRSAQRVAAADKLGVDHMADADHDEDQYLAENPLKAHIAGQGLIEDGAHHAG